MFDGLYEKYKELPIKELCAIMASYTDEGSKANIARLVYEERQREEEYEYTKCQIELQHKLNMELMSKQVKWIKFSAVLNAIAIIVGVVLGWYLSELKQVKIQSQNTQKTLQQQTTTSPSAHPSPSIPLTEIKKTDQKK